MNTKQRIIEEALILFSKKGYSDTYVGDIASAVGIKAPSLYKHFKSKQEIFDAILDLLKDSYTEYALALDIQGDNEIADADIYSKINEDKLVEIGKALFLYFLHNEKVRLFRKMLTVEQYKTPELSHLYTKQYFDEPIKYQHRIFDFLIAKGKLKQCDPEIMATQFYSPIYTLLTICDRDPEREKEAIEIIDKHIRQFNKMYTTEGN